MQVKIWNRSQHTLATQFVHPAFSSSHARKPNMRAEPTRTRLGVTADMRGLTIPTPLFALPSSVVNSSPSRRWLWIATTDGHHVFGEDVYIVRVLTVPYCYSHARRNAVAGSSANTHEPHGHSGNVSATNGSPRSQWHSTRAASTAESIPVPSPAELVRFYR